MAASKQSPREFLSEFIELYRSFSCLWHIKSKEYSDRNKRDLAYVELVKKYKEFDPSADRNTVVKKINALRTVYKKELAKVNSSLKSGAGADDVYKPNLWYFDLMHFLNNQGSPRSARSTIDDVDERRPFSILEHGSMAPKRSLIWLHFEKIGDHAKCVYCNEKLKINSTASTTNLHRHVEKKHPFVSNKRVTKSHEVDIQQISDIPSTSSTIQSETINKSTQPTLPFLMQKSLGLHMVKTIDDAVLKFIVKDFQPFSVVEDVGFKNLINQLCPAYSLPNRHKISKKLLDELYENINENVHSQLEQCDYVCLTTDAWTSRNTDSYLAVTAHYIDKCFSLKSCLLDCIVFNESHTAANISERLNTCINQFQITDKIVAVVTDNAANIKKAVRDSGYVNVACLAHTINLVVKDGLTHAKDIITKTKSIVEYFKRSSSGKKKLMEMQALLSKDGVYLKVIQDVPTRWNSTYHMLKRIVEIRESINLTIRMVNCDLNPLDDKDYDVINALLSILKPFDDITKEISYETMVTGSKSIILARSLQLFLNEKCMSGSSDPIVIKVVVESMKKSLQERFLRLESCKPLLFAMMLDPRYKKIGLKDSSLSTSCTLELEKNIFQMTHRHNVNNAVDPSSNAPAISETDSNKSDTFDPFRYFSTPSTSTQNHNPQSMDLEDIRIEIKRYFSLQLEKKESDPLQYWKNSNLINLRRAAQKYLCVQATSVPTERTFSKTGILLNDRRCSLKASKLQKLVFYNYNLKI